MVLSAEDQAAQRLNEKQVSKEDLVQTAEFRLWLKMMYPQLLEKFDSLHVGGQLALIDEYHRLKDRAITNWVGSPQINKILGKY